MIAAIISVLGIALFIGLSILIIYGNEEIESLQRRLDSSESKLKTQHLNFEYIERKYLKEIEYLQEEVSELQELNNISIKEFENLTLKQKRYILTAIKKVGLPFCETEDVRAWNVFKPNNRIVKITMNERGFIHLVDEEGKEYDPDKIITKKEEYVEFLENELNNIKK